MTYRMIDAGPLEIAYREVGPAQGWPVILSHGFPYDVHAYDKVATLLASQGARVIIPWLRGYGPTRFKSANTLRSGQQGALGADLLALMDALEIDRAIVAGYDWGGRSSCVVSALWPERVRGLVSGMGYNILDVASASAPLLPEHEYMLWYQYYLHGERGRAGLAKYRSEFCRQLWQLWSPRWAFDEATFAATVVSFANDDFVDVVVHSYRHRFGLVESDPAYDAIEARLAARPLITVPTIAICGSDGIGVGLTDFAAMRARFPGQFEVRMCEGIGHNLPQEAPDAFADAVLAVAGWAA